MSVDAVNNRRIINSDDEDDINIPRGRDVIDGDDLQYNYQATRDDGRVTDVRRLSATRNDRTTSSSSSSTLGDEYCEEKEESELVEDGNNRSGIIRMALIATLLMTFAIGLSFLIVGLRSYSHSGASPSPAPLCACDIQCRGVILQTIQYSGIFNDSKTFVDMPMTQNPEGVIADFNAMTDYSQKGLRSFLGRNFAAHCSDMLLWSPPDYSNDPAFLLGIVDATFRGWASDINSLWNLLGRSVSPDVSANPHRHTLLPLRSNHMIVPGGRFCEFYYWDSFWIIQGLLTSDMVTTGQMIVNNLVGLVEDYGFVPNGSREYYLNRSQPPMLSLMVAQVFAVTQDKVWLQGTMKALDTEYRFWMQDGTHAVNVEDRNNVSHVLNRYWSNAKEPRPESYVADQMTAWLLHNQTHEARAMSEIMDGWSDDQRKSHNKKNDHNANNSNNKRRDTVNEASTYHLIEQTPSKRISYLPADLSANLSSYSSPLSLHTRIPSPPAPIIPDFSSDPSIQTLFGEVTAAAESGWDFSSRWFHDRFNLSSVETQDLIPVDLNAIMYAVEKQLSVFHSTLGDNDAATMYKTAAHSRMIAIDAILWNVTGSQWQDYHIDRKTWKQEVMLSNWIPLWTKCYDKTIVDEGSVVSALLQSGLVMAGGIVTTLNNNSQQWDMPNAWPPLQWMITQGIDSSVYQSTSTIDNFTIYNSSALTPSSPTPPSSSCDIVRPDHWYTCDISSATCVWCFPSGPDLAAALSLRWLFSNYLAFNRTTISPPGLNVMYEKYFAPTLGYGGAGGEYVLQTGFGWSNGVDLFLLTKYGKHARMNMTLQIDTQHDYPYSNMAPNVETPPALPPSIEERQKKKREEDRRKNKHDKRKSKTKSK